VIAGPERKVTLISDAEKKDRSLSRSRSCSVINCLPESDPVQKVSIIARGMMGGFTLSLPEEDRTLTARKKDHRGMIGLLGGRAAEESRLRRHYLGGFQRSRTRHSTCPHHGHPSRNVVRILANGFMDKKRSSFSWEREISEQRDYSEAVAEQIDTKCVPW